MLIYSNSLVWKGIDERCFSCECWVKQMPVTKAFSFNNCRYCLMRNRKINKRFGVGFFIGICRERLINTPFNCSKSRFTKSFCPKNLFPGKLRGFRLRIFPTIDRCK